MKSKDIPDNLFSGNNSQDHSDGLREHGVFAYIMTLSCLYFTICPWFDTHVSIAGIFVSIVCLSLFIGCLKLMIKNWYVVGHLHPKDEGIYFQLIGSRKKGLIPYSSIRSISEETKVMNYAYVKEIKLMTIYFKEPVENLRLPPDMKLEVSSRFTKYVSLRRKIITRVPKEVLSKELLQYLDD